MLSKNHLHAILEKEQAARSAFRLARERLRKRKHEVRVAVRDAPEVYRAFAEWVDAFARTPATGRSSRRRVVPAGEEVVLFGTVCSLFGVGIEERWTPTRFVEEARPQYGHITYSPPPRRRMKKTPS